MKKQFTHPLFVRFGAVVLFFAIILTVFLAMQPQDPRRFAAEGDKPNIIVIMTDDQRWDAMETLPTVTKTLASRGVTFTNAYVTTPLCCPSRASFLTGLYTHNTGIWENNGLGENTDRLGNKNKQTIAVWLNRAGYQTALIGKYLNGYAKPEYVPPGWDKWFAFSGGQGYYDYDISQNGNSKHFGRNDSDYSTEVLRREAVDFIKNVNEPFFLLFTPVTPHPWSGGKDSDEDAVPGLAAPPIAPKHQGECTVSQWQRPPSFNEQDVSDKPQWIRNQINVSASKVQQFRRAQLCSLKAVDEAIADMLKALGRPRIDNTVIIFYSDNGYSYGEHKYVKKNCFYEECARTPMVISYPKLTTSAKISEEFALNIDLAPTIADLAGIRIPVKVNGKSLVPLLANPDANIRDVFLLEVRSGKENYTGNAIRTDQYKYTELNTGEKELYDLTNDPYELENKAANPEFVSIVQDLSARLRLLKEDQEPPISPLGATLP